MREVDKLKIMNYKFYSLTQEKSKEQEMMKVREHDID